MNDLDHIYAFRQIDPNLATAGQPSADDFASIQSAGFRVVINLALPTSDNAIPAEGSIVTSLGMAYIHLPVQFDAPRPEDFDRFRHVMAAFSEAPTFVHCAANMRVSAFVYLYRVLVGGIPHETAVADLHAIWEPNPTWARFIQTVLDRR